MLADDLLLLHMDMRRRCMLRMMMHMLWRRHGLWLYVRLLLRVWWIR